MKKAAAVEAKLITRRIYILKISENEKIIYTIFFLPGIFTAKDKLLTKYNEKLDAKVEKVKKGGFNIETYEINSAIMHAMTEAGQEYFGYMYID